MAIFNEPYVTGEQAAITDGTRKVTFDSPSDFADWLDRVGNDPSAWQWCRP
jgi:hypothetical protein